jgi:hypothetical protein
MARVMDIDTSVLNLPKNDLMFRHFGGQHVPSKRGCEQLPIADIEGDFGLLKSRLQLENWTGKSPQTVRQDVFSRVLTKNIVQVVIGEAQRRLDAERAERQKAELPVPKFRKTINATAALHLCKFTLIAYLLIPTISIWNPSSRKSSKIRTQSALGAPFSDRKNEENPIDFLCLTRQRVKLMALESRGGDERKCYCKAYGN